MARDYQHVFQLYNSLGLLNIDLDYEVPEPAPESPAETYQTPPSGINMPMKLKVKLMSKLVPKLW